MPIFQLNKLVRDKLPQMYAKLGQKATVKMLTKDAHATLLIDKIIEEVSEINSKSSKAEFIEEIADLQQVIDDLKTLQNISNQDVSNAQTKKKFQKGGFLKGYYIEELELKDDDVWVKYYRKKPKVFPEINKGKGKQ